MFEKNRYERKGFGLVIGMIIFLSYFLLTPILLRTLWPHVYNYINEQKWEKWQFVLYGFIFWHSFWFFTANIIMWIIYHIEHPFFERYKISSNPWPWYENRVEWD
jgi:hypothetical protein